MSVKAQNKIGSLKWYVNIIYVFFLLLDVIIWEQHCFPLHSTNIYVHLFCIKC